MTTTRTTWRKRVNDLPHTAEMDSRITSAMENAADMGLTEDGPDDGEAFWREVFGEVSE